MNKKIYLCDMEDNKSITGSQNRQILPVQFVDDIKQIVEYGLREAYDGANSILVKTYWNVGRRIVEEEQSGKERAEYGIHLIDLLSHELSLIYPKGYSPRNLRDYRLFYLSFKDLEIWHSRVPNLTWTHYRTLLSVTSDDARYWYVHEASQQSWSVRTLARNVGSQYAQYSVLHDSEQLFASKYLTYLPKKEELDREIERQKEIFYLQHSR